MPASGTKRPRAGPSGTGEDQDAELSMNELKAHRRALFRDNEDLRAQLQALEEATRERREAWVTERDELRGQLQGAYEAQTRAEHERDNALRAAKQAEDRAALREREAAALRDATEPQGEREEAGDTRPSEDLRRALARAEIAEREADDLRVRLDEGASLVRSLQQSLERHFAMERENERLRARVAEADRLEEELVSARAQLQAAHASANERAGELVRLEAELDRVQEWRVALSHLGAEFAARDSGTPGTTPAPIDASSSALSAPSPGVARRTLQSLRRENAALLERLSAAEAATAETRDSSAATGADVSVLQERVRTAEAAAVEAAERAARVEKQLLFVSKERDGYKRVLDSYANDETEPDVTQRVRSAELESQLRDAREHIAALTDELEKKAAELKASVESAPENALELTRCRNAKERVEKELARTENERRSLENEIVGLEGELMRAEAKMLRMIDPSQTKILHLAVNPASIATGAGSERARSGALDGETAASAASASAKEIEQLLAENEHWKRKVQDAEKRLVRLKEVFREKVHDFRQAVYELFGYKMEFFDKSQRTADRPETFRLRSRYAHGQDDVLKFVRDERGALSLLATPFTETLAKEIDTFLNRCNSIPAFLSHITMEMFNARTFA